MQCGLECRRTVGRRRRWRRSHQGVWSVRREGGADRTVPRVTSYASVWDTFHAKEHSGRGASRFGDRDIPSSRICIQQHRERRRGALVFSRAFRFLLLVYYLFFPPSIRVCSLFDTIAIVTFFFFFLSKPWFLCICAKVTNIATESFCFFFMFVLTAVCNSIQRFCLVFVFSLIGICKVKVLLVPSTNETGPWAKRTPASRVALHTRYSGQTG